jgi:hypothetical protein
MFGHLVVYSLNYYYKEEELYLMEMKNKHKSDLFMTSVVPLLKNHGQEFQNLNFGTN